MYDCGNYTYNVYPMLKLAFSEEAGIRVMHGSTGAECTLPLRRAIASMEDNPGIFRALTPGNGYGSYEGCLAWLRRILVGCVEHPLATLHIT